MKILKDDRVSENDLVQLTNHIPLIMIDPTDPSSQDGNAFALAGDRRALGNSVFTANGRRVSERRARVQGSIDRYVDRRQSRKQVEAGLRAAPKLEGVVLIVDGHPQVRADLEQTARSAGFDVCSAGDGAGALEILRTRKPAVDLLLIDLHAERPNSASLIGKALESHPALYVVMMSDGATRDEIGAGYAAGAMSLVPKPMPAERLQSFLKASFRAARIGRVKADERRDRLERHLAQPLRRRLVHWAKSCLYAPSHSRRGRMIRTLTLTGFALMLGAGMISGLQTMNESADHYDAMMKRAMQMMAPLQVPGDWNRDAGAGGVRATEQLQLTREANEVTRRYYEDHLQELRWQNRDKVVEALPVGLPDGRSSPRR